MGRVIAIGSVCGIEARQEDRIWFNARNQLNMQL